MAKAKFDAKGMLLKNGEKIAMGVSGFILAVLLVYGATKWTSAKDPNETANKLKQQSESVHRAIRDGQPSQADRDQLTLPDWLTKPHSWKAPRVPEFTQTGQLFDPTAQPNTKRENPVVQGIGAYQVDLTRSAMIGHDIVIGRDGEPEIAVLIEKKDSKYDADKVKDAVTTLKEAGKKGWQIKHKLTPKNPPPGGMGPGGMGPPGMGPGGMGPPGKGLVGGFGGGEGGEGPHGLMGGPFDSGAQRVEKAVKYIPLADLDKAVKDGYFPALTVIPLRLVTVHAVVPYKKQLEEMKRALRLQTEAEAKLWGPWYDGYEVQRRVTKIQANGQVLVLEDWPAPNADPRDTTGNYPFEEKYIDIVDTRSVASHFDEGYIPYFLKPEHMLAMPLPQLTKDLNIKYPDIKLKDITDNIEKLKKANQKEVTQSDLLKQVLGSKPKSDLYKPKAATGGLGYDEKMYGPTLGSGMGTMPKLGPGGMPPLGPGGKGGPNSPFYPEGYGPGTGPVIANEVDSFLLRFVDCDVKPGYTYEYRIRLRMWNPNYKQDSLVSNPEFAKDRYKTLYSNWTQTAEITVPAESFLYAHDVKAYRDQINTTYPLDSKDAENKAINNLLQVKDNQAVLQVATWMEQVRTDGGKREPVGAWVVAEMPVGRGEYVGRKQFIKLPLWSSETNQYLLREVGDKVVKGKFQPKGWLVDFSTKSVLVDFEGGKVKSRTKVRFDEKGTIAPGDRTFEEDVASEVLIVRPDGKLIVRSSQVDDGDPNRKTIATEWTRWVKEIEARKSASSGSGEANPFDPKKGP